jgi:hypothetical protein
MNLPTTGSVRTRSDPGRAAKAHEHDVQQARAPFALPALFVAVEKFGAVGSDVVLQEAGEGVGL